METIKTKRAMTFPEIMHELDEAIIFSILGNHSDSRISMPDYFIDLIISEFNIKKSSDMNYRGIQIIPSYENKIVVFNLDSPISKVLITIEL